MALPEEQLICLACGFCFDGTLFRHAVLNPGEKGHLPEKIEESVFIEGEKEYFRLPCGYFRGRCSIYDSRRADVCSAYRCQLLRDHAAGKVTQEEALKIVSEAARLRTEIIDDYRRVTGDSPDICFTQLLTELGRYIGTGAVEALPDSEIEILIARCNILEALLIRHIRSVSDFESMMAGKGHNGIKEASAD
ncbi:MAG: hypothetical protein E4G92_00600 [Bacteroidia bacterium]|nr:MAG: hypothetical protein E4G92_00600 [Bacteroidia bacterium]